jgi:hypothetical protein
MMTSRLIKSCFVLIVLLATGMNAVAQNNVPLGINYQAVARNSAGNELKSTPIEVRFSIMSGSQDGIPVFQETHYNIRTNPYGVFNVVIGTGVPSGDSKSKSLSEIDWDEANHYLKVEVRFDNDEQFSYMGTMQFFAVPYALYAQKSLEPGPAGPKGDQGEKGAPGDPASDDQTLSVVNVDGSDYLAISGGNQVKVSAIEKDGDPANEIQDLIYNSTTRQLQLTKSALASIDLSELKNDADADATNEIQDLTLTGDVLSISKLTGAKQVNLGVYRDNTDSQHLTYNESDNSLSISGGNSATLGTLTAFRAKKTTATSAAMPLSNVDFIPDNVEYNDGTGLNINTGEFTGTFTGIYSFDIKYIAAGNGKTVMLYKNGNLYETLAEGLSTGSTIFRTMTIKLVAGDKIKMVINTGTDTSIGTGTFSGYKVY